MPYSLDDNEIAILIKPMGNGQIGTCICKSDDHELTDEQLSDAMSVGLSMIGLFELLNDDDSDMYEAIKFALEDKIERLLEENLEPNDESSEPTYTTEGNVVTLNAFTRTKGTC